MIKYSFAVDSSYAMDVPRTRAWSVTCSPRIGTIQTTRSDVINTIVHKKIELVITS